MATATTDDKALIEREKKTTHMHAFVIFEILIPLIAILLPAVYFLITPSMKFENFIDYLRDCSVIVFSGLLILTNIVVIDSCCTTMKNTSPLYYKFIRLKYKAICIGISLMILYSFLKFIDIMHKFTPTPTPTPTLTKTISSVVYVNAPTVLRISAVACVLGITFSYYCRNKVHTYNKSF